VAEIDNGRVAPQAEVDLASARGLYSPAHEHDACGVGFVAHIAGSYTGVMGLPLFETAAALRRHDVRVWNGALGGMTE